MKSILAHAEEPTYALLKEERRVFIGWGVELYYMEVFILLNFS